MQYRLLALRFFALTGFAASSGLAAEHAWHASAFCPFEGSCAEVAKSAFGSVFGVQLYVVGLLGYALLFGLTFSPNRRGAAVLRIGALSAGLAGVALLIIQFAVLKRVCPLCLVADFSALSLAILAITRRPEVLPASKTQVAIWIAAAFLAIVGPMFVVMAQLRETVPEQARAHWVPGQVTVVELTDFDCPHCQKADGVLKEMRARHQVRFVRLVAPMPMHENAWPAARAYLAAKRQGKGDQMADALFAGASRSAKECRQMAADLGLDLAEFDQTLADPAIDRELRATVEWAKTTGSGLPMIWVQDEVLAGTPSAESLEAAITRAGAGKSN